MSIVYRPARRELTMLSSLARRHASTKQRHQATVFTPGGSVATSAPLDKNGITKEAHAFMKTYTSWDLFCYTGLSFVTAQPWLLKLATKALPYTPTALVKTFVCPVYTGGETFDEVRGTARKLLDRGIGNMMLSYAVEDADGSLGDEAFAQSVSQIKRSITEILVKQNQAAAASYAAGEVPTAPASGYIALKPTGLMEGSADVLANFDKPEYKERWEQYLAVCRDLCEHAEKHGQGKVVMVFDAEKDWLQKGVYALQREMMKEFNRNGNVVVAGTIQMYLQGSFDLLKSEIELAKAGGYQVAMKLVRGAYLHSEPDRWNVIHRSKADTDASYDAGTNLMFDYLLEDWKQGGKRQGPVSRLIVASHNFESCDNIAKRIELEAPEGFSMEQNEDIVFGQLMGMNDDQSTTLSQRGLKVVKYVPWGPAKECKDYLTRRLEENGDAARGGWDHFVGGCRELKNRLLHR